MVSVWLASSSTVCTPVNTVSTSPAPPTCRAETDDALADAVRGFLLPLPRDEGRLFMIGGVVFAMSSRDEQEGCGLGERESVRVIHGS